MQSVCLALHAELLHFKTIRIVATILLGDVVAVFAFFACQGDLGADIAGLGHCILTSVKRTAVRVILFEPGTIVPDPILRRACASSEGRT